MRRSAYYHQNAMSSRRARAVCPYQSLLENKRLNLIPSGRQLPRTPPTKTLNTQTSFPPEDPAGKEQQTAQNIVKDDAPPYGQEDTTCPSVEKSYRRSSLTPATAAMGNADPDVLIQGMQGYQWTDADLEFVYQSRSQKLQQELHKVKKTLQAEAQRLEFAIASRDQLQFKLSKIQSYDPILLLQLCKSVLSQTPSSDQLDGLEDRDLLSLLNLQDVQRTMRQENAEISHLETEVNKAQELRDKEEIEKDNWQKKISTFQVKISALKAELAELKTQVSQKEAINMVSRNTKVGRVLREVHKAAKSQAISDAPKPRKDAEEMTVQASVVSQETEKGRKGSRRAKPSTKAPREKDLKESPENEMASKEKAGKDMAEEGKTRGKGKMKASKKTTSQRAAEKELAPDESSSQVKTTPEEMHPKVKAPKVAQEPKVGRKGSRRVKPSTMALKVTGSKETAEKEMVPKKKAGKDTVDESETSPKEKAPIRTTSRKTSRKGTPPKEMPLQVKTPVDELLEKGRKGSRTAKTSSRAQKDKAQEKTDLKDLTETEMTTIKTAGKEIAEKRQTTPKIKAPKKTTSRAKKKLAPDEKVSQVNTPEEVPLEETVPSTAQEPEKGHKGSRRAKPSTKGLKETTEKETAPKEKAGKDMVEKGKTAPMEKAPRKTTSKKATDKELTPDERGSQVKILEEAAPEEMALNVAQVPQNGRKELRRAKTSTKALKEEVSKEMAEEGKTAPKEKATKNMITKKTGKKVMAPDESESQKKTPEETDLENILLNVKSSNVHQVHEKGQKGSRRAKTTTTAPKNKAQKKIAVKELTENEMDMIETADKEMSETGEIVSKIQASKKTTSKKTVKKELAQDDVVSQAMTLEKTAPKRPPTVKSSHTDQVTEKSHKGSRTAKSSTMAKRGKAQRTENEMDTLETSDEGMAEKFPKMITPKKKTSKKRPQRRN